MNLLRRPLLQLASLPLRGRFDVIRNAVQFPATTSFFKPDVEDVQRTGFLDNPAEKSLRELVNKYIPLTKTDVPSLQRQFLENLSNYENTLDEVHNSIDSSPTYTPDFDAMRAKFHQPEVIDALEKSYHQMYEQHLKGGNLLDLSFDQLVGPPTLPEEQRLYSTTKEAYQSAQDAMVQEAQESAEEDKQIEEIFALARTATEQQLVDLRNNLAQLEKQRELMPNARVSEIMSFYPELQREIESELQEFLWDPNYHAEDWPKGLPDPFTREAHYGPNAIYHHGRH